MALIQFYEDDLLGFVRFIDTKADEPGLKAQPGHIRLDKVIPKAERQALRQAIADDINGLDRVIQNKGGRR